jgi:import inner membrane translocase subunit TIM21
MAEPTPISQSGRNEQSGIDSIKMKFLVKGDKAEGWATMHLEKKIDDIEYHYVLLALDVPGHQRIYIEGKPSLMQAPKKILGVNWGRR